jgi:site-specific DNA-methyltransferase (adenine-specific)
MKVRDLDYDLRNIDCIVGMRSLEAGCVDVVVTSPPYNLGIKYTKYQDDKHRDDYLKWSCQWAKEVKRVLKPRGSFFLNLGSAPSNPLLPYQLLLALHGEDVGFTLQNTFHWIKSITVTTKDGKQVSAGHFKPIQSPRFVTDCHEFVFHLTKEGQTPVHRLAVGVPYSDKSNISRWSHTGGRDLRCRGNNWFIPYKTILNREKDRPHPATFPVELAENCIRIHGVSSEMVVLDPFLGLGHSALAAKRCHVRRFIGFEIDPNYLKLATETLDNGPMELDFATETDSHA